MNISKQLRKLVFNKTLAPSSLPSCNLQNYDKYLPAPSINYNIGAKRSQEVQAENFRSYVSRIMPFLVCRYKNLNSTRKLNKLSFLDIGCGFAPLAYSILPFLDCQFDYSYHGLDIRNDAISWLKTVYEDRPSISFEVHKTESDLDYVDAAEQKQSTKTSSDGKEGDYTINSIFDIQWSCSVFTHMTPEAIKSALTKIANHTSSTSLHVNTWLIVDEMSLYAMKVKMADRQLPIDCGDFLTYSEENPLVCSAYKIEVVEELYSQCGLEIIDILPGSWRGYADNGIMYQDLVLSRKVP